MSQNDVAAMFDIEAREAEAAEAATAEQAQEPAEAPVAPVEPTEEDEATPAPDEAPEAAEGDTEVVEEQPAYMGKYKTPEDMENAFREYQSHADKQLAQEQARREAYEQMISSEQQMMLQQQAMEQQQPVDVSDEDLVNGIKQAPVDTFQWAVQNNPQMIPRIIAGVSEEHGTHTAMELQTAWTNIQLQAQQSAMQQQVSAALEPQMVQQSIAQGLSLVENHYGEDFNALRSEVAENLKSIGQLPSYDPQTIAQAVEYSFLQAHRNRSLQVASNNQQVRTPSPQESVETGTPGQAPEPTETDSIKQGILDAYNNQPFK